MNRVEQFKWRLYMDVCYILSGGSKVKGFVKEQLIENKDLEVMLKDMKKDFIYESDKLWGVWNHIPCPSTGRIKVTGDCDDWASKVYDLLERFSHDVYLLTYFTDPIKHSHTVVVYKDADRNWIIIDWTSIREGGTIAEAIQHQEAWLMIKNVKITSVHFAKYDHIRKHRWVRINPKELI